MTIIRARQRAITAKLPHMQNRNIAIPARVKGGGGGPPPGPKPLCMWASDDLAAGAASGTWPMNSRATGSGHALIWQTENQNGPQPYTITQANGFPGVRINEDMVSGDDSRPALRIEPQSEIDLYDFIASSYEAKTFPTHKDHDQPQLTNGIFMVRGMGWKSPQPGAHFFTHPGPAAPSVTIRNMIDDVDVTDAAASDAYARPASGVHVMGSGPLNANMVAVGGAIRRSDGSDVEADGKAFASNTIVHEVRLYPASEIQSNDDFLNIQHEMMAKYNVA